MEQKLIYVGATPDERRYINVDGTLKLDVVNDTCDHILELFGEDFLEVEKDAKCN